MKKPGRSVRPSDCCLRDGTPVRRMVCSILGEPLASAPPIEKAAEGLACISLPVSRFKNWLFLTAVCVAVPVWRLNSALSGVRQRRQGVRELPHIQRQETAQFFHRLTGREIQASPSAALSMGGADARDSSGIEQTMRRTGVPSRKQRSEGRTARPGFSVPTQLSAYAVLLPSFVTPDSTSTASGFCGAGIG